MLFQDITSGLLLVGTTWATPEIPAGSLATNTKCSLTLLYQNNLNASDDANHGGAILLSPMTQSEGKAACSEIGELLMLKAQLQNYSQDFYHSLSYLRYSGLVGADQEYTIQDGVVSLADDDIGLQFSPNKFEGDRLPTLCTQSSRQNGPDANATAKNRVSVASDGNTYVGFWNQKSFRFQGIPYADKPKRFEYSELFSKTGRTIDATNYGASCAQVGDTTSSEDCLFLNIQTPFIPKAGSDAKLKPVLVSIHGGGFTGGNIKSQSGRDGGNLASREDIVSVAITYRLSTLGFLAVPGTHIKGNYGIADQVTALRWIKKNIAQFGGDPEKITIIGESAGAGSVRALLGSPPVIKEKFIAGAIAQANLGGGVSLGLKGNYGTTYSSYYTIQQSYEVAGQQIFQNVSCTQDDLQQQIACLKEVSAQTLVNLPVVARFVVQDGEYVNTGQLIVGTKNGSTAEVPIIFGLATNEGASLGSTYPATPATSLSDGIQKSLGISAEYAEAVIDSGLFPKYDSGNLTLDAFNVSQRIGTDITFRCIDEATIYAASKSGAFPKCYYYETQRTFGGYNPSNLNTSLTHGPISPIYPNGNPHEFYFKLHTSDLGFTYGNQFPLRDESDLRAMQLIAGYFAQFAKTGDPNPDPEYLRIRGYKDQLDAVNESGEWSPVDGGRGPVKALDYPSKTIRFPELEQCKWLNISLSYYLDGGA